MTQRRGVVISDFHTGNLVNLLNGDPREPRLAVAGGDFGQVTAELMKERGAREESERVDFGLVWTRPEGVVGGYGAVLRGDPPGLDEILAEVDAFASQVKRFAGHVGTVFVASWSRDAMDRGFGVLDMKHREAPGRILRSMNDRLIDQLEGEPGIFLLDAERWTAAEGRGAHDPRMWHLAKVPFSAGVFRGAVADVKAGLRAVAGRARKLLLLDLDDTLWGGIVGEHGWSGVRLGGHDAVGEAFVEFQRALKALARRGVVLGIVSKNDPEVALEAIREHPEMVLREEDFAGWRINWNDKARNVAELVAELNLGLDAAVFIDDNPAERGRVREALPQVEVPEWPADPLRYAPALRALDLFDLPSLSSEDRSRAQSYAAERERKQLLASVDSMDDWLARLELVVEAKEVDAGDLPRTVQLLNKTNQMNLRTRRMTEPEFETWIGGDLRRAWTVRVRDRFSDAGLTGLVSIEVEGDEARIQDFILSCRVFGREVEQAMVHLAAVSARDLGASTLVADYLETPRNQPCLDFFRDRSGFRTGGPAGTRFVLELDRPTPVPEHLELVVSPDPGRRGS